LFYPTTKIFPNYYLKYVKKTKKSCDNLVNSQIYQRYVGRVIVLPIKHFYIRFKNNWINSLYLTLPCLSSIGIYISYILPMYLSTLSLITPSNIALINQWIIYIPITLVLIIWLILPFLLTATNVLFLYKIDKQHIHLYYKLVINIVIYWRTTLTIICFDMAINHMFLVTSHLFIVCVCVWGFIQITN